MKNYLLLCCAIIFGMASAVTYDGYKVYRVTPENQHQINLLKTIHETDDYDFWTNGAIVGHPIDIMVSEDKHEAFIEMCKKYGIENEIFIPDVQSLIENEKDAVSRERIENADMKWDKYYTLDDIYSWLDQLVEEHPKIASVIVAGETHEGRPIKVLKLTFREGRRAVYIEGGLHAREWISPATTNYLISQLLTSSDPYIRMIADNYEWYIVPVANPDGYVHTHTTTRLWRKNRTPHQTSSCLGTDGNRNWDVFWGVSGTSKDPCDETYGGPKAASEAETVHLSKIIASIGSRLDVFLSFHSYGQMFLMPYGHTTEHLDNYYEVLKVGRAAAGNLEALYGTKYKVGNTAETIYSHSGGTMDWVKLNFRPPIAFTYELVGSPGGFVLPPEYILKNCREVLISFSTIFVVGHNEGLISLQ